MTHDTLGQQGYGQPQDWDADVFYPVRQSVLYQGGIWRAQAGNLNSVPGSGNAHWTLVGGTPYVDILLTPPVIANASGAEPLYDVSASGGIHILGAPGPTFAILILGNTATTSSGDAWNASPNSQLYWGDPTGTAIAGFSVVDNLNEGFTPPVDFILTTPDFISGYEGANVSAGLPVVMASSNPVPTGGSQSVLYRIFYTIVPAGSSQPEFSTFFSITAVDQGLKTFTVSPDPTSAISAGNTVSVVGSTGNNGTYTVASATATTVVVNEAIPDSTADGWVEVDA